ncbi:hypothetical protein [Erythrobacter sp. F6033]|nr:hypothetical protein [Erythrobacter sp. F6033]
MKNTDQKEKEVLKRMLRTPPKPKEKKRGAGPKAHPTKSQKSSA